MIRSLIKDDGFSKLSKELTTLSHAYLFYSEDAILNFDMAKLFSMSYFCGKSTPCFECEACKKSELNKNPDLIILDKPSILVEDIERIIDEIQFKPMNFKKKIIIINNAENINEIAQNKLLKSLEEPSDTVLFILTTTNVDKLLPTVRSRLKKIHLRIFDLNVLKSELLELNVKEEFLNCGFNLTEMFNFSNNEEFKIYFNNTKNLLFNLKTTANIPNVVMNLNLNAQNKYIYLNLISKLFNSQNDALFGREVGEYLAKNFSSKLIAKINLLIEESYKELKANVNANYVYDNLFYKILKEKYLCKQ